MRDLSDDERLAYYVISMLLMVIMLTLALPAGLVALAVRRWRSR